ncbi:MAG: restriction endonuclease subunit S [Proteobacteria bacterium]|nr:restriction endonuclease subunit S [Pseudomonadota bacterium]
MSVEFEKVRIGDLGKVVTGKTPPTAREEYFGADYPFITPTDIDGSKRHVETERYLSQESKKDFSNYLLPSGAICFVCIGATIGKICMTNVPSFTNQQINSIIVDGNRYDNCFIYYLLSTKKEHIKNIAGGAATPIVSKSAFSDVFVEIPELIVQKKITAILSAYDDLIENNLRRIKISEEMAQTLYREWFVKFRFPGHQKVKMVNSPLGKIPEGWEIRQIDEVIETLGGGTPSTKEPSYWEGGNINWYSPSDLTASGSMFITGSSKKITQLGLDKSSAKLFPAYSLMMTSRATIGVISINTEKACTNQGFITCIPNDRLSVFHLYFWIKENREKIISVASGATFKEISRGEFREFPIVVPPLLIENTFVETVEPIRRLIENLIKKNHNLVVTRDLLLPKLISGELDISELDISIPEAHA